MLNELLEAILTLDMAWRRRHERVGSADTEALETKAAISTILRAVVAKLLTGGTEEPIDADALVRIYIASGARWRDLAAAVSRHALEGSTRSGGGNDDQG